MTRTLLTVVGARPQFIKAAPVNHALRRIGGVREILIHTGQHFDAAMSDIFFQELDIAPPEHNLEVNSLGHGAMTGRMLEKLEAVMLAEKPDAVMIYGDTNSTVAGALAAAKLHIPVAHVEAGLRSFNRRMPEEINRVMADHLSALLLSPTHTGVDNLKLEGITKGVHHVGDVMYDITLTAVERARGQSTILDREGLVPGAYQVATIHRAENTDDPERFERVLSWLEQAAKILPVIMPIHPRTRKVLEARGRSLANVRLIAPLGYLDMAWLLNRSASIMTDSGGLQKEAYFHRVPCTTLRDETEWVETVEAGWNRLWTAETYAPRRDIADYGSGQASDIIAAKVKDLMN